VVVTLQRNSDIDSWPLVQIAYQMWFCLSSYISTKATYLRHTHCGPLIQPIGKTLSVQRHQVEVMICIWRWAHTQHPTDLPQLSRCIVALAYGHAFFYGLNLRCTFSSMHWSAEPGKAPGISCRYCVIHVMQSWKVVSGCAMHCSGGHYMYSHDTNNDTVETKRMDNE